jgi:hypothetical protein
MLQTPQLLAAADWRSCKICVKDQHFNEYEADVYETMAQRHILSIVRFLYCSEILGGCLWT